MLDLTFNPISKFYEAPIQLKANGGVFVVDDFGRQRIPPRDLLNRWIVPLESRVDFLTLHTGRKFEMPFNVLIVFATNLKPESLADEAFLRRIPYKILAKNPTMDEYCRIFELNCKKREPGVRSGDGRVSEPQVLPAAQAADARLPSARPRRAGRRHVPLSESRAGRSRASCSTRRAAATSSRRPTRRGSSRDEAVGGREAVRRGVGAGVGRSTSGLLRRRRRSRALPRAPSLELGARSALADDHRRAVHVDGGPPRRGLPADRPPHRPAAARERGARRRAHGVPARPRASSIAACARAC